MLVSMNRLIGTSILSMQSTGSVGTILTPIIDPSAFKILAFYLTGPLVKKGNNILDVKSIREYSRFGCVIDSIDELIAKDDVIKISKAIDLNFNPIGLKVETKKGSKLGHVIDFTVTSEDFIIQQIIIKRPLLKSFNDSELTIPRREIIEVTDYKIIVKDEEKIIKKKATHEDFIPNFVNPFRNQGQDLAPTHTKSPADQDIE